MIAETPTELGKEVVRHIAELIRLELTEEEQMRFQQQLSDILTYVNKLQEVTTQDVEPTSHVTGLTNVVRSDEASVPVQQEAIHELFPDHKGSSIRVRSVFL